MVQKILERGEIERIDHAAIPRLLLPEAAGSGVLYRERAARLRSLAAGEVTCTPVEAGLAGYLRLMAEVAEVQASLAPELAQEPALAVDAQTLARAHEHQMPPLSALGPRPSHWQQVLDSLLTRLAARLRDAHAKANDEGASGYGEVLELLAALQRREPAERDALADAVLAQRVEDVDPAAAPFFAAALQLVWSARVARLSVNDLPPLADATLCPACGSQPVASVIRLGAQSQGYRYLHCALCETEWHMVRVKCSHCEANGKIAYQGLSARDVQDIRGAQVAQASGRAAAKAEPGAAAMPQRVVRAEICDDCHHYRKIFNQEDDYNVDALADDLASLTLDMLVGEAGYERASINPLLWLGAQSA